MFIRSAESHSDVDAIADATTIAPESHSDAIADAATVAPDTLIIASQLWPGSAVTGNLTHTSAQDTYRYNYGGSGPGVWRLSIQRCYGPIFARFEVVKGEVLADEGIMHLPAAAQIKEGSVSISNSDAESSGVQMEPVQGSMDGNQSLYEIELLPPDAAFGPILLPNDPVVVVHDAHLNFNLASVNRSL